MRIRTLLPVAGLVIGLAAPGGLVAPDRLRLSVAGSAVAREVPPPSPDPLVVMVEAGGTRATYSYSQASTTNVQGAIAPEMRVVALRLMSETPVDLRVRGMRTEDWRGRAPDQTRIVPTDADGTAYPDLASATEPAPDAPIEILREGRLRGDRVAIIGVRPVFLAVDGLQRVTWLDIFVPDSAPYQFDPLAWAADASFALSGAVQPPDPLAARWGLAITVRQPGVQRVTGAALAAAGLDIQATAPDRVHVWLRGAQVALDARGAPDARIDPEDEFRFYAPEAGDRWNHDTVYWLTIESGTGLRMQRRDGGTGSAPAASVAVQRGVWRAPAYYDSLLAGPSGDHWFSHRLLTGPGLPSAIATASLTAELPMASGVVTLRLSGSSPVSASHVLRVAMPGGAAQIAWQGSGDWTRVITVPASPVTRRLWLPLASSAAQAAEKGAAATVAAQVYLVPVRLELLPGDRPDIVQIDTLAWQGPAALSFQGHGASFAGDAGPREYRMTGAPLIRALYDVTDPLAPEVITLTPGAETWFTDPFGGRSFALAGEADLRAPQVTPRQPTDLAVARNAQVVYIAPQALHNALAPLVSLRRAQGYTVTVVDTQAIYDGWSHAAASPGAIRAFLRHAVSTWRIAPQYVTLVGDGTSDPRDYLGKGARNVNLVPPYLAMVDPYIGETACENCYAFLDGDDPLTDALPDLAIGRLPVKSAQELQGVVAKIVGYESAPAAAWHSRIGFVADNFRSADGSVDLVGDFALMADSDAALQPRGVDLQRMYYDPYTPTATLDAWREMDARAAYTKTVSLISQGAGIVNYYGHGHQFQYAVTHPFVNPYDASQAAYLFYWYDTYRVSNGERLPLMLNMSCLTTAFQTPLFHGETIDERMVLAEQGGAIAVMGSAGFGVAYGRAYMQRGLYSALWARQPAVKRLGQLTTAAYVELLTHSPCCTESARTFALLGDAAGWLRVSLLSRTYIPLIRR
jgi:hypothetical protein